MQGEEKKRYKLDDILAIFLIVLCTFSFHVCSQEIYKTDLHEFEVERVVDGLSHPWGIAFLPEGGFLVTERFGNLRIVSKKEILSPPIEGLPKVAAAGQGGSIIILVFVRKLLLTPEEVSVTQLVHLHVHDVQDLRDARDHEEEHDDQQDVEHAR